MRRVAMLGVSVFVTMSVLSVGAACSAPEESETVEEVPSPVIAVRDWNAYPMALISGRLELIEGCLLVGDSVAFWAEGTSWDPETRSVVFDSTDAVRVGEKFFGGGGQYEKDKLDALEGLDAEAVIECMNRTGSSDAVIAIPTG